MNNETIEGIIETQKLQTETIKELMGICTELVDRVKTLENRKENYLPVTQLKDIPIIRIDSDGYTGGIEVKGNGIGD